MRVPPDQSRTASEASRRARSTRRSASLRVIRVRRVANTKASTRPRRPVREPVEEMEQHAGRLLHGTAHVGEHDERSRLLPAPPVFETHPFAARPETPPQRPAEIQVPVAARPETHHPAAGRLPSGVLDQRPHFPQFVLVEVGEVAGARGTRGRSRCAGRRDGAAAGPNRHSGRGQPAGRSPAGPASVASAASSPGAGRASTARVAFPRRARRRRRRVRGLRAGE